MHKEAVLCTPTVTARLIFTLPRVFLSLGVVRLSCYYGSFVLCASCIPSVSEVSLLDVEWACICVISDHSALSPGRSEFLEGAPHVSSDFELVEPAHGLAPEGAD